MMYLSQLLGTPVEDEQGERVGKLIDILTPGGTRSSGSSTSPFTLELVIEGQEDRRWLVPADDVEWHDDILRLRVPLDQLTPALEELAPRQISLAHSVLDRQVIDISHKKAVRVNDIVLDDGWHILGVDNSTLGLVRRLAPTWLLGARSKRLPAVLIPWERIELIGEPEPEQEEAGEAITAEPRLPTTGTLVRTPSGQLGELRPADIADIVHHLTPGQGARLIEGLDDKTAADTLEEIDTDRQGHILENIDPERAASILAAMEPDEVADLLARLPEERAQELLHRMSPEESEDVQELLEYGEDTAGGLMTTDLVAVTATKTVAEALDTLRRSIREDELRAAYIYCVEDEAQEEYHLLGRVSVWDLLVADPAAMLRDIMESDPVTVAPDADPLDVAEIMAKYNLLAVPVVSEGNMLEGVITVDDALDIVLPEDRRRRPTRMY
jgi:magnesium transporter